MLSREIKAASFKPIVLGVLARGESYGYRIIQQVSSLSDGQIDWTEGALYPVLHRLEKAGLLASSWRSSPTGRRRKYYRITDKGKKALVAERKQWTLAGNILDQLWIPQPSVS